MSIPLQKQLAMGRTLGQAAKSLGAGQAPTAPTRTPIAKRYPKVAANAMNPTINASPELV